MFVFDWFLDWIYGKVMEFIQTFFTYLSGMGVEIFELSWIQAVVEFFRLFGWAMYVIALVVAVFDVAIGWQNGQGNIKDAALGAIKGFMAASLFTIVPIELYKLAVEVQNSLGVAMSGLYSGSLTDLSELSLQQLTAFSADINPFNLFTIIALGYRKQMSGRDECSISIKETERMCEYIQKNGSIKGFDEKAFENTVKRIIAKNNILTFELKNGMKLRVETE